MVRLVEHYSELYLRETVVTNAALNSIIPLPVMDELSAEPTIRGFGKAIDDLLNGKSPSSDGIPPEMIEVIAHVLITRR